MSSRIVHGRPERVSVLALGSHAEAFAEFLAGECWEFWGTDLTESHPLTKVFELWVAQQPIEEDSDDDEEHEDDSDDDEPIQGWVSKIMEDAVNRAKPCKKDQCHAMTKKGFRCKNVAGGSVNCKKHSD